MPDELPIVHDKDISELGATLSDYRPSWDEYFMLLAKLAATRSTCYSRPVGAVIVRDRRVLATGYNGAAPGAWHCTDKRQCFWRQPENQAPGIEPRELSRAIHAEMNAMAHAARKGIVIEGGAIYCTLSPCMNCFKVLVSAGIKKIFFEHIYDFNNNGGDKFLLDFYKQYSSEIEVRQLIIRPQTLEIAVKFLTGPTSERRHDNY
ncbi:MAG: dCMP deaminase family protein [Candidatus Omnitrophica bacterium]|nr:dCMP deaminase family protein [Candidatus Omnitrophota bacterium]